MIDTHIHIDEEAFAADSEQVIARQQEKGVTAMIVPGVNAASVETVLSVCRAHKGYCFAALGLHPEDVKEDWETQWKTIEKAIRTNREELVAIGEIGLDYYWDTTYKEQQKEVLRRQLLLARELNLPVILHNRNATEDILKILQSTICNLQSEHPLRGVFHCFNGSRETAEQILKMGFYLCIGGVITFKNCKLAETLKEIRFPETDLRNRLLLETDAPYMAPVPHRGERNESQWMIHVAERLAEVFDTTPQEICTITTQNAKQLFGI
ncbi:MAG: TatD family hydrolase [Paludibacteraceae bacterium]|nr:TatD family hydrolase [Paludibacteraceae bacterium]